MPTPKEVEAEALALNERLNVAMAQMRHWRDQLAPAIEQLRSVSEQHALALDELEEVMKDVKEFRRRIS